MLNASEAQAIATLADRLAVRDVVHRYTRGIDRHDVDILTSVFFEDGIDNHGRVVCYRGDFIDWGNKLHEGMCVAHGHYITTQLIRLDGDEAESESYVLFILKRKDLSTVHIGGARYLDRLERRGGLWRIELRRVVMEWRLDVAQDVPASTLDALAAGTWDRSDPSYKVLGQRDG